MAKPNCALVFKAGFFEDAFSGMEELANEGIVEPGLPFLDDGHF